VTKNEFLDRFLERAGIPKSFRTPDGVKVGVFRRIAVSCPDIETSGPNHFHAGRECLGWILIEPPNTPKYRGGEYTVTDHR
jgi:hypothetical protein